MTIGVVVVMYRTGKPILDCLESLVAEREADLRVLVVDNCSPDDSVELVRGWAADRGVALAEFDTAPASLPKGTVGLLRSPTNRGFAGGVNLGVEAFRAMPDVDYFWILNPDCIADPGTAALLERTAEAAGSFAMIGGRIFYSSPSDMIQSDGGRINFWTGTCYPCNLGATGADVSAPAADSLDYISGAHMLVSRAFVDQAGPMPERYFLFYEEIDWCQRRGTLPILFEPRASVHHVGGATIGSATLERGPSPLAAYFMTRNRLRFVWHERPYAWPVAFAYVGAKAVRMLLKGQRAAGMSALRGLFGLAPDKDIQQKIGGLANLAGHG